MTTPWFDPESFAGWYGLIVGGFLGALAAVLCVAGGFLAAQEKGRALVLPGLGVFTALGGLSALLGVVALAAGQPLGIWAPPLIIGVVMAGICGALLPSMRRAYDNARSERRGKEAAR